MAPPAAVRMDVATVCQLAPTDSGVGRYVVVLDERGGDRRLPIWVGEHEGIALAFARQQAELPRPLTHQLTASLLEAAGARVKAARITRLAEATFYATVTLQTPAGERQVDARPSDALVLALLSDAEVSVDDAILEHVAAQACATALPDADEVEREALARAPEIVSARLALMQRLREQAPRRWDHPRR